MTTFEIGEVTEKCGNCLAFQFLPAIPEKHEFDYPLIGLCRESASEHYGHTIANTHPCCDGRTIGEWGDDTIRD